MKIPNTEREVRTVGELTEEIRHLLEDGIGEVLVEGEISNFKQHTSGHRYFTLKDGDAQIQCVMWRSRTHTFQPQDGMKVLVGGRLSVYAARGNYQIDCVFMRPAGIGDLYAAFEKLKKDLALRGWFDASHKKPLPRFITSVGVATSQTGAAVRDIFSTIARRFPLLNVVFRPTLVQGDEATPDIVRAIDELTAAGVDVIIIGRGGGSIEDLWSFNTEAVASAIHRSHVPIISAVGHETDVTIADFVADVRAATPTAAAELVTPITRDDLIATIDAFKTSMTDAITENIEHFAQLVEDFLDGTAARRVSERLLHRSQRIDELQSRIAKTIQHQIHIKRSALDQFHLHITALHPYRPLKLGYAIVERNGKALSGTETLHEHDNVELIRYTERSIARIESTTLQKQEINGKVD